MNSDALTPQQLAAVAATLGRQRDYLSKLRARMDALKFPGDDTLYVSVLRSWEALSNATVVAASKANRTIMQRKPWSLPRMHRCTTLKIG